MTKEEAIYLTCKVRHESRYAFKIEPYCYEYVVHIWEVDACKNHMYITPMLSKILVDYEYSIESGILGGGNPQKRVRLHIYKKLADEQH